MPEITATEKQSDKRIDVALANELNIARTKIQKLIKTGDITINGKKVKPHTLVQTGDILFYPELLMNAPQVKEGPPPVLDILFQDDNVIVINKPAGLLVHESVPEDISPTVVDAILEIDPDIANVGEDPRRPGIVHRLDKDVSGIMVIAKTQSAYEFLKSEFQSRKIFKEYLALAYGQIQKNHDVIKLKIARSKTLGRMVARPEFQEGKEAITLYDVIERFKTATYLRVQIKTGRTHQIRAHFKAIDHPLVGDKLYKKTKMKNIKPIELNRIFLHAHKLEFSLPDGTLKSFEAPLPIELEKILKSLPK
ncbi:MAG: RluA family pseudouridine synthase [Patescibacteria group bacterium]